MIALGAVDPEIREVIEEREEQRSVVIDAISHRLIARYQRRATVEALWALTSFPVFDSIRRHAVFEEAEMLTGMAITIVDPHESLAASWAGGSGRLKYSSGFSAVNGGALGARRAREICE